MASRYVVVFNPTANRLEIVQAGDTHLMEADLTLDANFTVTGNINSVTPATWLAGWDKLSNITVITPVDLDAMAAKTDFLTVTGAVDLDTLNARVNELDAAVVLKGSWDASTLLFPASTTAGESWICSVAGTVDGVDFEIGDRVVALIDAAPNNAYVGNWLKLDYTDKVSSVAGKTGVVTLQETDITDLQNYLLPVDLDSLAKLNALVGDTVLTQATIDTFAELQTIVADETILAASSIDTLAKLNAILAETLIDTTDSRLSDARTPTAHTHSPSEITGLPVAKSYNFSARTAASGVYYLAGFYDAPAADANLTQAAPTVTHGGATAPYAAHAFMVFGAGSTDGTNITITVTGTSITDAGVRTPADSEVLYTGPVAGLTLNDYLETSKKWLGTVTYTLTSDGVNFTCDFNYGYAKYDDYSNLDAQLNAFEFVGLADAADTGFEMEVIHHKAAGWTYDAAAFVPGPVLYTFTTDHGAESDLVAGENFAWKRTGLAVDVAGSGSEGMILRITTSVNNSVRYLNAHLLGSVYL